MKSDSVYRKFKSEAVKTFVSEDGFAAITCPNCGLTRHVPVADYRNKQHSIKVRCQCKNSFTTILEFRQHHRKSIALSGIYDVLSDSGGGRASIKDLSRNGVGFMISGIHNVRVGHTLLINFSLDNHKQTELRKKAVVRSVNQNRIGCEFMKDQAFEKDFGFYLRS